MPHTHFPYMPQLWSLPLYHAYQFKLGPYIVNRSCTVNAVLGCPFLDFVQFMSDIMLVMKIVFRNFKTNK